MFLRPLETKSSDEIAVHLHNIYNLVGPPHILQSDQGKEFKGAVQKLMAKLNVRVVVSAPYKPQTQGKVSLYFHCLI